MIIVLLLLFDLRALPVTADNYMSGRRTRGPLGCHNGHNILLRRKGMQLCSFLRMGEKLYLVKIVINHDFLSTNLKQIIK
jgi:hypothetical protein